MTVPWSNPDLNVTARPIRVAILDDEPCIRRALSRLLGAADMVVDTYEAANPFFASLALTNPDCLLLDFQMPEMTGLDVLKYLNRQRIRIHTIVITGHDQPGIREACLKAGGIAYLLKPVDPQQLIDMIVNASASQEMNSEALEELRDRAALAALRLGLNATKIDFGFICTVPGQCASGVWPLGSGRPELSEATLSEGRHWRRCRRLSRPPMPNREELAWCLCFRPRQPPTAKVYLR